MSVEAILRWLPECPSRATAVATEDTSGVAAQARKLGLLPLLAHYLPNVFELSRSERMGMQFSHARLWRSAHGAVDLLGRAGIRALVLKGVPLGAWLYPQAWLRPTSDVDLLVHPKFLAPARSVLTENGYREFQEPPESAFDFWHHCSFVAPSGALIELHFTPSCGFQSEFDVSALMDRAASVVVEKRAVEILGLTDALVHLCVHAAHHRFEGVKWLFDIKLLLAHHAIDWAQVVATAIRAKVAAVTGTALSEAFRRIRAPVPEAVLGALEPRFRVLLARSVSHVPKAGIYPLSLVLADRLSVRWGIELLARPIERGARAMGREAALRAALRKLRTRS